MLADEVDERSVLVTRQSCALTVLFNKFKPKAQLWLTAVLAETVEVSKPHCA